MGTYKEFRDELLAADGELKAAYDRLDPQFAVISELLELRRRFRGARRSRTSPGT